MRKKLKLFIGMVLILMGLNRFHFQEAHALDFNGVIDADSRWTTADSPVHITGDVHVEPNTSLTIEPGVDVIFKSPADIGKGYSIRVDGTLIARGKTHQPIIFTAEDRSIPWGAILFGDESRDWNQTTTSGCILEYCVFEYGGNEPSGKGMIVAIDAAPFITRNAIRFGAAAGISALVSDDPAAVSTLSGNIRIVSNQIYNNPTGIRLLAEGGIIEDNYFLNNGQAIDLQVRTNDVTISDNTVVSSSSNRSGSDIRLLLNEAHSGIAAYQWRQTGGTPVELIHPQNARASFLSPDPGNGVENLTFDLTVTNKNGLQAHETVKIDIVGENPPPVAKTGADLNVQLPEEEGEELVIMLSGENSVDPYLGIVKYAWKQTEGITVDLQGADTVEPTFTVPASVSAGDRMTFQLTVTDQAGLTSTDSVDIIFYDDNIFPVAAAGNDQRVSQGNAVFLDGSASRDPDGSISAYEWVQTNGLPVNLINPNTAKPRFEPPEGSNVPEVLTFRLKVTDNGGLQDFDDIAVTVNGTLTAGAEISFSDDGMIILDGSASLDRNAAATVDIVSNNFLAKEAGTGLLAITANENASYALNVTWNNLNTDEKKGYLVYLHDWPIESSAPLDMPGNWWGVSDALTIESFIYDQDENYSLPAVEFRPFAGGKIPGIGSSLPYPPLADAGPDMEAVTDTLVTLDGSRSYDPENIAQYRWKQTGGPMVDLKNANQAKASFIAPPGGPDGADLQFELSVSTDGAFTHSDTANAAIRPESDLPTVDVGGCFIQTAASQHLNHALFLIFPILILIIFLNLLARFLSLRFKLPAVCIFLTMMFIIGAPARAGYLSVGGGAGGDADDYNVTLETGAKDIRAGNLDLLFGVGIFLIPHSDDDFPDDTISFPCPNVDCIRFDTARKGNEVGFLGKLGIEIGSSDFYVSGIGGFTAYTESEISFSPATGRYYEESSDSTVEALYGGGISYFIDQKWKIVLEVDYDNIRGVTGLAGLHW